MDRYVLWYRAKRDDLAYPKVLTSIGVFDENINFAEERSLLYVLDKHPPIKFT